MQIMNNKSQNEINVKMNVYECLKSEYVKSGAYVEMFGRHCNEKGRSYFVGTPEYITFEYTFMKVIWNYIQLFYMSLILSYLLIVGVSGVFDH